MHVLPYIAIAFLCTTAGALFGYFFRSVVIEVALDDERIRREVAAFQHQADYIESRQP
jgi:hypothetical protein